MMKFNAESMFEPSIRPFRPVVERREPYIDIYLKLERQGEGWPDDLAEPGALVICRTGGEPIQYVVLDEGCDCEYRFTEQEKEQLKRYIRDHRLWEWA